MTDINVTDHAVLRYLQRRHRIDIEELRRHMAGLVASGVEAGASGVIVEGVKLVLQGTVVVTVLEKDWPTRWPQPKPQSLGGEDV